MIIEEGYLGYLKYDGDAVEEGIMDARLSAEALLGFDEVYRYFIKQEKPSWQDEDLNLPVRIERGCWEIMIPAGMAVFAGYYLKATAEKAGQDGLFETGTVKDLNRVLKAALVSLKWIVRISKHVGGVGEKDRIRNAKIQDMDHVVVYDSNEAPLVVPQDYLDMYTNCPAALFGRCTRIIEEGRELEIGSFESNEVIDPVRVFPEERSIFYREKDEDQDILFPEFEHGMSVELDGEITRVTESTNTLGFRYQEHVLFCKPREGKPIASFKQKIISRQDGHIFPKVRMIGVIDREDVYGNFKAHKPGIVFSDIQRLESVTGELFG
ncbi:MAG: hypothetical protein KJ626_13780 [Verrucomicrobia bacterium]|nr:hypothetical protein [Verrucomicrobiota bacterium]